MSLFKISLQKRILLILILLFSITFADNKISGDNINVYGLKYSKLKIKYPKVKSLPVVKAGATVYYIDDNKTNFFKMTIDYPFGSINDRPGFEGETYFTFKTLISGGSENFPIDKLDSLKDIYSIDFGFSVGVEHSNISLKCLKDKKDVALKILEDIITNPEFDSTSLAISKRGVRDNILRELEEPSSFASKKFKEVIYGNNAYGRSIYGDTNSLKKIDVKVLKNQYNRIKFIGNINLGVVGDVSFLSAPLISWNVLGNTNKKGSYYANNRIVKINRTKKDDFDVIFYNKKDLNQTIIRWGNRGTIYLNKDYYKINMATSILGGGSFSSRLMNEIRVKRGLSYGVGFYGVENIFNNGYFVGQCQTKTASTAKVLKIIMSTNDEFVKKGIKDSELKQFKKTFVNNLPFLYDSYSGYLSKYMNYKREGRDVKNLKKIDKIYSSMEVKDINKIIKKYIKTSDKMKYILVGNYDSVKDDIKKIFGDKKLKIKVIEVK